MADLEFLVTDGAYTSALSEPATYIDLSLVETAVSVVPDQIPEIALGEAPVGLRSVIIQVRVRVSEVAQPAKGDKVIYHGREHFVDDFDRLNIAEWILHVYVT